MKLRNSVILIFGLIIGFFIVRYLWASFSMPYINLSVLLLLSIYVWTAIRKKTQSIPRFFKYLFTLLFWFPVIAVSISSVILLISPLDDWPAFLRVYFVGGLFSYVVSLLIPVLFLFIADIVKWMEILFKKSNDHRTDKVKGNQVSRRRFIVNTGLSLGGIALGTMGFGMLHGNYAFKIWRHRLKIAELPNSLSGLKIVQISDFHLGTWVSKNPLTEAVEYINDLKADLVFFTGDLVNSQSAEAFPFAEELSKIKSRYGIFASLGNHDYGHYHKWASPQEEKKNWDDLIDFYKNIGWTLLRNENETIHIKGSPINIIGVENWSINPRFPQVGDLDKAVEGIPFSQLNLLLSHDPTHWEEKVKHFRLPMHITFSGHTHGFQFGIESSLFRWSPAQYIYKHWAGIYADHQQKRYLNVNRGIGAIGFPGRIGIKPEITLIEVV